MVANAQFIIRLVLTDNKNLNNLVNKHLNYLKLARQAQQFIRGLFEKQFVRAKGLEEILKKEV
jgi:hypothetical protein